MFKIVWLFAFILNGVPHIDPMPDQRDAVDKETCIALIIEEQDRMADWVRGRIGAPLYVPVGVRGQCIPVTVPIINP